MPATILFGAAEDDMYDTRTHHALANHFHARHHIVANDMEDVREALKLAAPLVITSLLSSDRLKFEAGDNVLLYRYDDVRRLGEKLADQRAAKGRSELEQEPVFCVVWSPEGKTPPRFQHITQEAAEREARRLSAANPGCPLFVLEPTFEITIATHGIVRYRRAAEDEVPF